MAFQGLPNNCENENSPSELGQQLPLNELEGNTTGVFQPPSPLGLVRELLDESQNQNFEVISPDVQFEQVRGMELNFNQQQEQALDDVALQVPQRPASHRVHMIPDSSSRSSQRIRVSFEQVRGMEANFNLQQGHVHGVVRWQAIQVPGSVLGRPESHCVHWIPDPAAIRNDWILHHWIPRQNSVSPCIYRPLSILPFFMESSLVQPPIIPSPFSSDSRAHLPSNFSTPPLAPDVRPAEWDLEDLKDVWDLFENEDVNKELSQEKASTSSKNKIDEKDGTHSAAQTTKYKLGDPSTEGNAMEANPKTDEGSGCSGLDGIMEEADGSELSVKWEKLPSLQLVSEAEEISQLSENSSHGKQDAGMEEKEEEQTKTNVANVLTGDIEGDVPEMEAAKAKSEVVKREDHLALFGDYRFSKNNPKAKEKDPYYEGLRCLCEGDFANAVLGFEATLTKWLPVCYEQKFMAWGLLGVSQAANEQDLLAINALRKFLKYQYHNLHAIMFLSICYWYENYKNLVILQLWRWLFKHPTYYSIANYVPAQNDDVSTTVNRAFQELVVNFYSRVIDENLMEGIDYNVYTALGLLHNIVGDYSRAVECFDVATQAEPRDEITWNLLGEAHINNESYDLAFPALHRALGLRARYPRARYYLGIAFSKTGNQMEAMISFVKALSIQSKSSGGFTGSLNAKMWESAKATIELLGRTDLEKAVDDRDIASLEEAFGIEEGWLKAEEVSAKKSVYRFFRYVSEN